MKAKDHTIRQSDEAEELKSLVKGQGVDLVGVADLRAIRDMPLGIKADAAAFLGQFRSSVVLGAQLGKPEQSASGTEASLFLEHAALAAADHLERNRRRALIVHTEDEFDPVKRMGLMSLKILAKAAGLGWQGRSLLIVSPTYGPVHRWIAVLTDMKLPGAAVVANQCGDCALCVEECPAGALKLVDFDDHPVCREDVLDIDLCRGDDGCMECITVCPWGR